MELLAHFEPRTLEPLGVWQVTTDADPELCYADDLALSYAKSTIAEAKTDDWADFARYLTERTPYHAWWEFVDVDARSPKDALEQLRQTWAGVSSSTTSARFAASARRIRFRRLHAERLADQVFATKAVRFEADRRVSATISVWRSPADDQLAVIVGPGERQRDIDTALGYGLCFQGDRDLHLVLPAETRMIRGVGNKPVSQPTLHRVAHLCTPITVWTQVETDELIWSQPALDAQPEIIPPRHQVLTATRLDDALKVGRHDLGDRQSWIEPLRALAEVELHLDSVQRPSYLAWHLGGRQVLKVQRSTAGIRITAGTDYSSHRSEKRMATVVDLNGPPTSLQVEEVRRALTAAIEDRTAGEDDANLEHLLQARLATSEGVSCMDLVGELEREVPATRPGQRRAFIDLLGVDANGDIHVVETKLDADPMLALQGLDYWTWATAYRDELTGWLRARGHEVADKPEIRLDCIVGTKTDDGKTPDLGYLAPQLEALVGSIPWRVGVVSGWRSPNSGLELDWSPRREIPSVARSQFEPRFAVRLQTHLAETAAADQNLRGRAFHCDAHRAVVAQARPVLTELVDSGLTHRFVNHVRSSQLFAVNLFGGLDHTTLARIAQAACRSIASVEGIRFEYVDAADRLREASTASPHTTQADVALFATDHDGTRRLVLIEVKLSEDDFGHCTAYEDPDNDRLDVCSSSGAFGGEADHCFKLRNHNRGGRRRYDTYVEAYVAAAPNAGCLFRRSANQPMRYAALAGAVLEQGGVDHVTIMLCAHDDHTAIWRRWRDAHGLLRPHRQIEFADMPASIVLNEQPSERGRVLADRYRLDQKLQHLDAFVNRPVSMPTRVQFTEWEQGVPSVWRAIAADDPTSAVPAPPGPNDDLMVACAYWTPLLQVLVFSFGWTEPAKGLAGLRQRGYDHSDPRQHLIHKIWETDGQLDWFHAWLITCSHLEIPLPPPASSPTPFPEGFALDHNSLSREAERSTIPNPLTGGSDPLHLSAHFGAPAQPDPAPTATLTTNPGESRAALVLEPGHGWYHALQQHGGQLPPTPRRSWRIEVIAKPIGWLGTYRQSHETGIWFSGQHRYHELGN